MLTSSLHSIFDSILGFIRKFSYVFVPLISALVGYVAWQAELFQSSNDGIFDSMIMTFAVTLTGFMLAAFSIFLSFPDDKKVIETLNSSGYTQVIYTNMFVGVIFGVLTSAVSLSCALPIIKFIFFSILVGCTCEITYFIFRISIAMSRKR